MVKTKPWRSRKYLDWVKSLPCCHCHAPADDPHHIIGFGGRVGSKVGDNMAVPLCRQCHDELHRFPLAWESAQVRWLVETQQKAFHEGILGGK